MSRKWTLIVVFLMCWMAVLSAVEERYALVIGNAAYANSPLLNPVNDATAMNRSLTNLGFKVTAAYNVPTYQQMVKLIRDFGLQLQKGGVGLFYYAGHGVQIDGKNYLVPTMADIRKEGDVELEAVDLDRVLNEMQYARNEVNIIILDACRDNPYSSKFRSSARGLASITKPVPDCLIAYATQPNGVARDGDGANGIFTEELLRAMDTPGLSLTQVMMQVRTNVKKRTNDEQLPWENSLLTRDFYFKEAAPKPVEVVQPKAIVSPPATTQNTPPPTQVATNVFNPNSALVTAPGSTPGSSTGSSTNRDVKYVVYDQPKKSLFNMQFNLGVDFPGVHSLDDGTTNMELNSHLGLCFGVEALLDINNLMIGVGLEYALARNVSDDTEFYLFTSDVSFLPIYLTGKYRLAVGSSLNLEAYLNLGISAFSGNDFYELYCDELTPGAFVSTGIGMSFSKYLLNFYYKVNTGTAHEVDWGDWAVSNGQAGIGIGYRLN